MAVAARNAFSFCQLWLIFSLQDSFRNSDLDTVVVCPLVIVDWTLFKKTLGSVCCFRMWHPCYDWCPFHGNTLSFVNQILGESSSCYCETEVSLAPIKEIVAYGVPTLLQIFMDKNMHLHLECCRNLTDLEATMYVLLSNLTSSGIPKF